MPHSHRITTVRFAAMLAALALVLAMTIPAEAHFGMLIPSADHASQNQRTLDLTLSFSHPFGMQGMELVKPKAAVFFDGQRQDLTGKLAKTTVMGHTAWKMGYDFKRPGVYAFVMEPQPYWEPAEDCFIVHLTKTLVPAFGGDEGWDEPLGLAVEIVPLTRPFGNYAGDTFTGQVLAGGNPVPGAEVEVELYNKDKKFAAPTEYNETQVVKADGNGVFTFACPQPGWWGFAALITADNKLPAPDGSGDKDIELGGVLWTYMHAWR